MVTFDQLGITQDEDGFRAGLQQTAEWPLAGRAMALLNAPPNSTATAVDEALAEGAATPTYVYLGVVRSYIRQPR